MVSKTVIMPGEGEKEDILRKRYFSRNGRGGLDPRMEPLKKLPASTISETDRMEVKTGYIEAVAGIDIERERKSSVLQNIAMDLPRILVLNKGLYLKSVDALLNKRGDDGPPDNYDLVRRPAAQSLPHLAKVDKKEYLARYEKNLKHWDMDVREEVASGLGVIAGEPEFKDLFGKGLDSPDPVVKRGALKSLYRVANEKPALFEELYRDTVDSPVIREDQDKFSLVGITTNALTVLAQKDPERYVRLYKERMEKEPESQVKGDIASTIHLIAGKPAEFMNLFKQAVASDDPDLFEGAASHDNMNTLAKTYPKKCIEVSRDLLKDSRGYRRAVGMEALRNLPI